MERITQAMLERKVAYLNELTGNPKEPYTRNESGQFKANRGNYHLSGAYGGWQLNQMCNEGGGCKDIFYVGYVPKRELFNLIAAYINGITAK